MARKLVSEMTAVELAEKHAKSAARRAARKDNNKAAIEEIVALLSDEQFEQLSDNAKKFIQVNLGEFRRNAIIICEGDTLAQLFMKYPNLSYKKLQKKCNAAGLVIDATGTIVNK